MYNETCIVMCIKGSLGTVQQAKFCRMMDVMCPARQPLDINITIITCKRIDTVSMSIRAMNFN